jgi:hypothetical protein
MFTEAKSIANLPARGRAKSRKSALINAAGVVVVSEDRFGDRVWSVYAPNAQGTMLYFDSFDSKELAITAGGAVARY